MARITFYTDEDVSGVAIKIARHRGASIVTANEAGMSGAEDEEHFVYAIERGFILVSANVQDFRPLFDAWVAAGREYPGMVLIPSRKAQRAGVVANGLCLIYESCDRDELKNRIRWV
jgi:hypothetical protein